MTLTVVGSIAFDAVETPSGSRDRLLGGSAVHFSLASSQLAETRVVGPVGDDFGADEYAILHRRGVITDDIEHVPGGKTFFWAGRYHRDINHRDTLQTDLNVFEDFRPKLSDASRAADVLFLANIQPELQREVREQCAGARFVAMDSMNLWIDIAHVEPSLSPSGSRAAPTRARRASGRRPRGRTSRGRIPTPYPRPRGSGA